MKSPNFKVLIIFFYDLWTVLIAFTVQLWLGDGLVAALVARELHASFVDRNVRSQQSRSVEALPTILALVPLLTLSPIVHRTHVPTQGTVGKNKNTRIPNTLFIDIPRLCGFFLRGRSEGATAQFTVGRRTGCVHVRVVGSLVLLQLPMLLTLEVTQLTRIRLQIHKINVLNTQKCL